ncbi:hypothetical protein [Allorhodopirellula solitaria]|uniref:Uncharacterized protein n=1 Tax=Allorhodopirellula solitaria TaxID=2527987 RepID=A0A5C5XQK1_9BACT|nr:hypothetical protein [Allorhodopirellula solitaria]TWT64683.1 hypothetical protein CA85_38160 [Allorhodopirellula solitaria]
MMTFPQYGLMPRWPENGQGFIHPDDVSIVSRLIPSERVLRRNSFDGRYYHYTYGEFAFRLLPCMWLPITAEGLDIGDEVETLGVGMERDLFVGVITGMYYVRRKGRILYRLRRAEQTQRRLYLREHLRLLSEKQVVRPGEIEHPTPTWNGSGDRITDW